MEVTRGATLITGLLYVLQFEASLQSTSKCYQLWVSDSIPSCSHSHTCPAFLHVCGVGPCTHVNSDMAHQFSDLTPASGDAQGGRETRACPAHGQNKCWDAEEWTRGISLKCGHPAPMPIQNLFYPAYCIRKPRCPHLRPTWPTSRKRAEPRPPCYNDWQTWAKIRLSHQFLAA